MKTYYQKHRRHLLEYQRAWAAANQDNRRRNARAYYVRNWRRIRAKACAYYAAHREARLDYAAGYAAGRRANKEVSRE